MLARRPRMTSSTVLPERSPSASAIGRARVGRCPIRRPSSRSPARPPRRPADPPTSPARRRDHPTPRNRRSHYASAPAMPALGSCPERRLGPGHAHGGRRRPQPRDARTRTSLRETCKNCCVRGAPEFGLSAVGDGCGGACFEIDKAASPMSRVRQKQLSTVGLTVGMLSAYPGSCSVPPHVNMDNTTQLHQTEHQLALIVLTVRSQPQLC